MKTVAIINNNHLARHGVEKVLGDVEDLRVVLSIGSVAELGDERPDVLILNPACCADDSPSTIRFLAARSALLVVSCDDRESDMLAALRAGALGFVTHGTAPDEFVVAVTAVAHGAFFVTSSVVHHLHVAFKRRSEESDCGLTPRESETLRLIAHGYTHSQIARRLGVTHSTANTYAKRIRAKLEVGNKADLTRKAIELGYVDSSWPSARSA